MPLQTLMQRRQLLSLIALHAIAGMLTVMMIRSVGEWYAQLSSDRVLDHTTANQANGALLSVGKQNFFECPGTGEFPLLHGSLAQDTQASFLIYEYTNRRIDPRNAVYPSGGWLRTHHWVGEQFPLLQFTRGNIYYVWTTIPLRMQCGKGLSHVSDSVSPVEATVASRSSATASSIDNQLCLPCGNGCLLHDPAQGPLGCPTLDEVRCVYEDGLCMRMDDNNTSSKETTSASASSRLSSNTVTSDSMSSMRPSSSAALSAMPASASVSSTTPSSTPLIINCPSEPPPFIPEDFIILRDASLETFAGNTSDVTVYYRSGFNPHHIEKEGEPRIFGYQMAFGMGWDRGHRAILGPIDPVIRVGDRIRLCGTVGNCSNYVTLRAGPLQPMWVQPGLCPSALWR